MNTPTPWKLHSEGGGFFTLVCGTTLVTSQFCARKEDAQFILKTVNLHGELAKELREPVARCNGSEGVRADGSNIQTIAATALLQRL